MKKLVFILCLVLLSSLSLFAQNEENCSKKAIEGDEIILTPNLAGRNISKENLKLDHFDFVPSMKTSNVHEISTDFINNNFNFENCRNERGWGTPFPIFDGDYNQKAPNMACDDDGKIYCAFEDYDNSSYPNTWIRIRRSNDDGATWDYFGGCYSNTYGMYLPSIVYANGYVFTLYHMNNTIGVYRKPIDGGPGDFFQPPTPNINPPYIIHRARLCSDSESYEGNAYLMLAYVYGNGNNYDLEIYYTLSIDDGESWTDYDFIDYVYESYWTWEVGIDWGDSGLYISYLGTGLDENKVMMVKSTDYGSIWSDPDVIDDDNDDKFGPIVAARDAYILVVYQYKYNAYDNDIYAAYSDDYGGSWHNYIIADDGDNEELLWVAHDNDNNFCVTYNWNGEVYAEIGNNSPVVENPEQINNNSLASDGDYTTVIGKTIHNSNSSGFMAAWAQGPWGDLDIWGNYCWPVSGVDDIVIIEVPTLFQNYPNPFNPETTIEYNLNENSNVLIEIYNIKGQKVKTLINDFQEAGYYSVIWNGKDSNGKPVASGLYFYSMQTDNYSEVRKMILLK